jgi:hypothetical protein
MTMSHAAPWLCPLTIQLVLRHHLSADFATRLSASKACLCTELINVIQLLIGPPSQNASTAIAWHLALLAAALHTNLVQLSVSCDRNRKDADSSISCRLQEKQAICWLWGGTPSSGTWASPQKLILRFAGPFLHRFWRKGVLALW